MTDGWHDTPSPAELRGLPRSSYARSHALPWEAPMQDVLSKPFVTITIDQRSGGWHGSIAWPTHHIERFTDLYGEPTLASLASAIHEALLVGLGDCRECSA